MAKTVENPGAFLAHMLEKYRLNSQEFSRNIRLSQPVIRLLITGKAKITIPVAVRLAKYFNTNPEFWLAMQMKWDLAEAGRNKALMKVVKSIPRVSKGTASSVRPTGTAAKKKAAAKKPAQRKKTAAKKTAAKKTAAKRRISSPKKPVSRKKTVTARKKTAKTPKRPVSRRRSPKKR